MRQYRILQTAGALSAIGGALGIIIGLIAIWAAFSGSPSFDWRAFTDGITIFISSCFAIAFSELIALLIEIRARLAGTYIMSNPKSVKLPNPPAPMSRA